MVLIRRIENRGTTIRRKDRQGTTYQHIKGDEMKKQFIAMLLALFFCFLGSAAHADLVTESFTGTITYSDASNPFGVEAGDTFTWDATYDLVSLDSFGMIAISADSSYHLNVLIGDRTFIETEDEMYETAFGGPFLYFDAFDDVNGVNLLANDTDSGYRFRSSGDGLTFDIYSLGEDGFSELLKR
jgi:hypothetical protein